MSESIVINPESNHNFVISPDDNKILITSHDDLKVLTVFRGEKGDPGVSSNSSPRLETSQNISALRIVSNINGQYDYANPLDQISVWSITGISLQSVNSGGLLTPVNNQVVTDNSWNWVRGSPVFLGTDGTITQVPNNTGYLVVVARVYDEKKLFIHIEDPIQL